MRRIVAVAGVALLAACGDGGGDEMSDGAARDLQARVAAIEAAAVAGDPDSAHADLESLRGEVADLLAAAEISESRAVEILAAAAAVEAALGRVTTTTTSTTTTTTTTPPPPPPPPDPDRDDDEGDEEEDEKDNDKGHGRGPPSDRGPGDDEGDDD